MSVVPRKTVNAAPNEDETELRICVFAVLAELPDGLGFLHEEAQNLREGQSKALLLEDRNLMQVTNSTCGTPKPSLNVTSTNEGVILFSANLSICSLRSSGFSLIHLGARRWHGSVAMMCPCPFHICILPNWASTNETEQTAPNSNNITANVGQTRKTDKKMKPRATEPPTYL